MTKAMKKVLSVVLSVAMIATSITFAQKTVKADAPVEHNIANVDTSSWVKLPVTGGDAGDVTNEYYINGAHTLGQFFWGIYAPDEAIPYHDQRANCVIEGAVFACQEQGITSVWVNGTEYANHTAALNNDGDCAEISLDLLEVGENVVTFVYGENTYETFAIKVQGEQPPVGHDINSVDTTAWTKLDTKGGNADDLAYEYAINSAAVPNLGQFFWGIYAPDEDIPYHNERDNCIITDPVFACQESDVAVVWVNGNKYGNPSTAFNNQGDCTELSTGVLEVGQNVITFVYKDETTETFAIKVTEKAGEVAPDQTLTGFDWVAFPGGVFVEEYGPESNPTTDKDGHKVFISSNAISGDGAFFKTADIYGLYTDAAYVPYVPATCTVTGATLSFAITSANNGTMKSVWVDGVKYANKSASVYLDGDQVHLSQDLITLDEGETEKVTYITVRGNVDNTFAIKVEEAATYTVSIDGTKVADVTEGDTYTLPTTAQFGYFVGDDLYKAGAQVVVNGDIDFTSLNSVAVTMANGAVVKNAAPAGIAFQATVAVNENEEVVDAAFLSTGMLITANDLFEELGGGELSLDSKYTFKNVANEGWYGNTAGTYRAGISGVTSDNYIRKFIARGYAQLTYTDGTVTTVYSDMSPVRSIKQVAQSAIAVGAGNAFLEEIVAAE
ncbi:MAG: hypothetical protein K6G64_03315 [Eubacterium sp.]|nr:hypothetical protein [Eubacterium sp.]